jgi:hypothetical protein
MGTDFGRDEIGAASWQLHGLMIARALAPRDTAHAAKQTSRDRNCIREWTDRSSVCFLLVSEGHWDGLEIEDKGA